MRQVSTLPQSSNQSEIQIEIPQNKLRRFCKRWQVREFALFGSVLRQDFRSESDVDVLVSFESDACWSLLDLVAMQEELEKMFGRKVDLVEKEALRNPYRKRTILESKQVLYAAPRS